MQKENLYNFTLLAVQCNFIEEILRIVEVKILIEEKYYTLLQNIYILKKSLKSKKKVKVQKSKITSVYIM